MLLRIKKRSNYLSLIIPKRMVIIASTIPARTRTTLRARSTHPQSYSNQSGNGYRMGVNDNDEILATRTPSGYEISAYDPSFAKKIEAARQGMRKYRNALIELAK